MTTPQHKIIDREQAVLGLARLLGVQIEHKGWSAEEALRRALLGAFADDPTQCLNAALEHKREADFEAQFQPMPEGKMSRAYISEMYDCDDSDYMGDGCEWNTGVDLLLGPDGNIWAKVGTLNDVPNQPDSEDDEGDDAERGDTDPPLFLTQGGIYVWHGWHAECLSENWYTTDPEDADIDHGGNAQFDVRDRQVAPPVGDDGRADHRGRIIAAIDAGLITEDGYADPDDLAEEAK